MCVVCLLAAGRDVSAEQLESASVSGGLDTSGRTASLCMQSKYAEEISGGPNPYKFIQY